MRNALVIKSNVEIFFFLLLSASLQKGIKDSGTIKNTHKVLLRTDNLKMNFLFYAAFATN